MRLKLRQNLSSKTWKIFRFLDPVSKNRKFKVKIRLGSSTTRLLMLDSWGKFSIFIAFSISFRFLELFLYSMLTEKDKNWFQLKYFRWKSSTFKIFTLLLHHKLVHQNNFVVQVIRFWKKKFYSFWIFKILRFWRKFEKKISLSDRWAAWEYLSVNISARVRTRKLKICRKLN